MKKLSNQFLTAWKYIFDPSFRMMSRDLKRIANEVRSLNSESDIILALGMALENDSSLLSQMIETGDLEQRNVFRLPNVSRPNSASKTAIQSFCAALPKGRHIRMLIISEKALWIPEVLPIVEEMLRFISVVENIWLTPIEEVQVDDTSYSAGEVNIKQANRDPMVVDHPDEVNWNRPRLQHLAFGIGVHHCLGSWFARKQTEIWLQHFLHWSSNLAQ